MKKQGYTEAKKTDRHDRKQNSQKTCANTSWGSNSYSLMGFRMIWAKKKISPIYLYMQQDQDGQTCCFFLKFDHCIRGQCSRENVSLLTISQHTWRCLSSQQAFSWRFTTLYMQNWHRNCSKLPKRPMQQWGRFLAFFMEYCNDNLLIMSQHDSGVYFWCADWCHGLKFWWHLIDPGKGFRV